MSVSDKKPEGKKDIPPIDELTDEQKADLELEQDFNSEEYDIVDELEW